LISEFAPLFDKTLSRQAGLDSVRQHGPENRR